MQIKAEYACLQAYLTQFIWRSNHMSKKQAVKQRFCEWVLNSYMFFSNSLLEIYHTALNITTGIIGM